MRGLSPHLPAAVAYITLTLAYAWPLVIDLAGLAPHDAGDPLLSTWILWWNARAIPFTDAWWSGPFFHPAANALAFSDHRVGLGPVTTPLILGGMAPMGAHNVAFLLTFVLSALAAYALVFGLTKRRDLAFVGGLVFGFHPFRADHLPHLELLASFWLPLVFLALHRVVETGRTFWHVALAASLVGTAFTTGYYFFYAGVLIGAWLAWFLPWDWPRERYARLAIALVVPFAPLVPVLLRYRHAHTSMGLSRTITDIETFSADVRGFVTPPDTLWLWSAPASWHTPEGAVFPGVAAVLTVVAAIVVQCRGSQRSGPGATEQPSRRGRLRAASLAVAVAAAGIALVPRLVGAVAFDVAGLRVSVSQAYKPFSVAVAFFLVWALTSRTVRDAWHRRSLLGFYALATLVAWAFALGPTARLAGERVLYKAPYAWLMVLPGFAEGFRAPARFVMLGALMLAVAAAVAAGAIGARLTTRSRQTLIAVVAVAVLADGWVRPFPTAPVPKPLVVPSTVPPDAVVMELPMGVFEDAAAMYRATLHEHPIVNGLSGYEPPHYGVLRAALQEGRFDVIEALPTTTPLALFLDRARVDEATAARAADEADLSRLDATASHYVLLRGPRSTPRDTPGERLDVPIASVVVSTSLADGLEAGDTDAASAGETVTSLRDDNIRTVWVMAGPQEGDEGLIVQLAAETTIGGVALAQGPYMTAFGRELVVDLSMDGARWSEVWRGDAARATLAAAIADPPNVRVTVDFAPALARFVRVRQVGQSDEPWAVAELDVLGPPRP